MHCPSTVPHFNSIKVRLKHLSYRNLFNAPVFQFHKGTIETQYSCFCPTKTKRFQFHKGTIETLTLNLTYSQQVNFNSIKVRLKL